MIPQEKIAVEEEGNRRFGRLLSEGYDASDLFEAYINGAEFLDELRKPLRESLFEWAQRNGYSLRSDMKWEKGSAIETDESLMRMMNAELSGPSERPNIKNYLGESSKLNDIHEQIIAAPRLYAYTQDLDSYIDRLSVCNPSEDLVKEIESIFRKNTISQYGDCDGESSIGYEPDYLIPESLFNKIATEIASLVSSSRRQENDAESTVMVKDVKSELASLQSFILLNLPSDIVDDYHFPDSTSRKTIRVVMDIIRRSNERFMDRVRKSIAILEANKHESK